MAELKAASALLMLPDGRIVLQRRDDKARISANMLSTFGGGLEGNETPEEALRRELFKEETHLDPEEAQVEYLFDTEWERPDNHERVRDSIFKVIVPSLDFEVREGEKNPEVYTIEELEQRQDLSISVLALLKRLKEAENDEQLPIAA